jgi:excisionase family DNA binding protein
MLAAMLGDYVRVAEAAEELGISVSAVHKAIDRGKITAEHFGPLLLIHRSELDRFKALPRRRGRPPKPKA